MGLTNSGKNIFQNFGKNVANSTKNMCEKLGKNNKPTYAVMSIAVVKGICRPTFTMMDKKEKPETKKYTALREGLTEAIAVPVYYACGELSGKMANVIKPPEMASRAQKNLMFLGVCAAALVVIPALCSVAIKPIMDAMGIKKPEEKHDTPKKTVETVKPNVNIAKKPYQSQFNYFYSTPRAGGMKVGGV
ncbi:MAG: hypothetical protein R3Y28_04655 [Candidatus Gastranaerophilales bacterium]